MLTICNEPVKTLQQMRSPRVWQGILSTDLPGKIALAEIQLNHALASEERQDLDKRLLALYASVVRTFAKLHGEGTRCFLARAPESLCLVGHHIKEFGGSTNGIAMLETLLCVAPRTDGRVSIAHIEERFGPLEFDLLDGLPKARAINWAAHVQEARARETKSGIVPAGSAWCAPLKRALQYYVNRHKGPTGQIELNIPGLNIVVGAILPLGAAGHSETTLAAAGLAAAMTASGEWGQLPLNEFSDWLNEAQSGGHGRRSEIGSVVFGMAGQVNHVDGNPARAKGRGLQHGFSFLTAHTGVAACPHGAGATQEKFQIEALKTPAIRSATTAIGIELLRQIAHEETLALNDEAIYRLLRGVPVRAGRAEILGLIKSAKARAEIQARFEKHPEPAEGYNLRGKLLYVLGEMRRADRATSAIRAGDAAGLGALMNIGQAGEANLIHDVSALGQVREVFNMPDCDSDAELHARADDNSALWRESGRSGASSPETDLLCDIASVVPGVLGARYCEPNRVAILCRTECVQLAIDALVGGYYAPRGFPAALVEQVYPCQGVGIFAV